MRCCCDEEDGAVERTAWATWPARLATLAQWAVPITTLALVPKCPGCVAAYVILFTGVGLSLPTAAAVRWGLIGLSVAAIVLLALRGARRLFVGRA